MSGTEKEPGTVPLTPPHQRGTFPVRSGNVIVIAIRLIFSHCVSRKLVGVAEHKYAPNTHSTYSTFHLQDWVDISYLEPSFHIQTPMAGNKMHHDVRTALEVAARRRHRKSLVRKEKQKHKLTTQAYHHMQMQLNEMSFLAPMDADNTKSNIYYVKRKFMRYKSQNASQDGTCC